MTIHFSVHILEKLTVKYSRASGPGGQHVNKGQYLSNITACIYFANVCYITRTVTRRFLGLGPSPCKNWKLCSGNIP